jgi:hypothetical protein
MSSFPKIPTRRCQEIDCSLKISGDLWECSSLEDGFITNCIDLNRISFYLGDPKIQILKLDYPQLDSLLPPTLFATEMIVYTLNLLFVHGILSFAIGKDLEKIVVK